MDTVSVPDAVHQLVASAAEPRGPGRQPGRFRIRTYALGVLTVAGVSLMVAGGVDTYLLGVLLALPCGIGFLVAFINDLLIPAPNKRQTARQAALCFVKSLRMGSWRRAYACVQPSTFPQAEMLPMIERLRIVPSQTSRRTLWGFTNYWKAVLRPRDGMVRLPRKVKLSKLETRSGECVRMTATFRVEIYAATTYLWLLLGLIPLIIAYLIVRKKVTVHVDLLLYRHRSQWWVLASPPRGIEGQAVVPTARIVGH